MLSGQLLIGEKNFYIHIINFLRKVFYFSHLLAYVREVYAGHILCCQHFK